MNSWGGKKVKYQAQELPLLHGEDTSEGRSQFHSSLIQYKLTYCFFHSLTLIKISCDAPQILTTNISHQYDLIHYYKFTLPIKYPTHHSQSFSSTNPPCYTAVQT